MFIVSTRNLIEKNHSDLVAGRREQELPDDDTLLAEFNSAKDQSWSDERVEGQRHVLQQRDARRLILAILALVFLLMVVLVAVSF